MAEPERDAELKRAEPERAEPERAMPELIVGWEQPDEQRHAAQQLDRWLAEAATDGDEGAFEQLVRRHTPALYAAALRTTGSPQTAQDIVQEAWLSVWLHLPGFRGQSQVRTWLVRITTTKALNALRRPPPAVPIETAPEPLSASTEQDVEQRERAAAVRSAVAALPTRQREAVVLRDLEGLSYEQVSAALNCSVGSVKSALFRGRHALARALATYRPGDELAEQQQPVPASPAAREAGTQRPLRTEASGTKVSTGTGISTGSQAPGVTERAAARGLRPGHP